MRRNLTRGLAIVLLLMSAAILLTGCGTFRPQALEAQSRIDESVQRAEIAEAAAARNTGQIIELRLRIEALEATLDELQDVQSRE